jgi:hypothetical protein
MRLRKQVLLLTMASMAFACGDDSNKGTGSKADASVEDQTDAGSGGENTGPGSEEPGGGDPDAEDAGPGGGGANNGGSDADASAGHGDAGDDSDSVDEPGPCEKVTMPTRILSNVEKMWGAPRLFGDYVYYGDDKTIKRISKCGGDSESIVTSESFVSAFDVHDGVVYFRDGDNIASAPAEVDSTKSPLVALTANASVWALDATADGVFWAETDTQALRIRKVGLDGNNAVTLFEGENAGVQQLTVHKGYVYWLSKVSLVSRVPLEGSSTTATTVLELPGGTASASEHFAVDDSQVYVTDDKSNMQVSLWRAPVDGSKPEGIGLAYISSGNPSAVAVSKGTVYFASRNSTSRIYKIGATADFGTTPEQVGTSTRIQNLLVDAHDIIIRAGDGPYHLERLSR